VGSTHAYTPRITASIPGNLSKPVSERQTILDFNAEVVCGRWCTSERCKVPSRELYGDGNTAVTAR